MCIKICAPHSILEPSWNSGETEIRHKDIKLNIERICKDAWEKKNPRSISNKTLKEMKHISSNRVTHITSKGFEKLQAELEYLHFERRREISDCLRVTQDDIEDFKYLIALDAQAFVGGQIHQLEKLLRNVMLIRPSQNNSSVQSKEIPS